jgi:hypothetical protein
MFFCIPDEFYQTFKKVKGNIKLPNNTDLIIIKPQEQPNNTDQVITQPLELPNNTDQVITQPLELPNNTD